MKSAVTVMDWNRVPDSKKNEIADAWSPVLSWELGTGRPIVVILLARPHETTSHAWSGSAKFLRYLTGCILIITAISCVAAPTKGWSPGGIALRESLRSETSLNNGPQPLTARKCG